MDKRINAAFLKLKTVLDPLANKPTEDKLIEFKKIFTSIPIDVVQTLHEFILFPFFINLRSSDLRLNNKLNQNFLETLQCILQKTCLKKIKTFTLLHMELVQLIYDKNSPSLVASIDEELKLSIVQCLELLFHNMSVDLRYELYTKKQSLQLSQCCHICIQLAKNEKLRILRITAIESIMAMAYIHDEADFSNKELRCKVADVMLAFLPGITIGLKDIATGDVKQGHKITALAIKVLSRVIVLHMQDDIHEKREKFVFEYPSKNEIIEINSLKKTSEKERKVAKDILQSFNNELRTEKWFKETANKLKIIIELISPLQYHDHPKVRYQMSQFCEEIPMHCFINMADSVGNCLEILIAFSEDDDPEVSKNSRASLNEILQKSFKNSGSTPLETVEENFYKALTRLPRIMNEIDSAKKLNILNLLTGYLRILGPKYLYTVLQSSSHLKRLVMSLIHVSQLERPNISLFEEHAVRDFEVVSKTTVTWKQFTYLTEESLQQKFQVMLQLLTESDAAEILIDNLCDLFSNTSDNRNEIIFLLNELLSVKVNNIDNRINIIKRVFNMYLEEENWYLPCDNTNSEDSGNNTAVPLFTIHNNIIQICLLVEGIGNMAKALEENFKPFLFKALYVILERAGSAQPLISTAGFQALSNMSKACGYQNVTDLITDNTDYFSFHVIQRLKRLERNPNVLDVLNLVMNYSTVNMLPPIMDITNKVLLQSCDKFQEQNSTAFLKVFRTFIQNLYRWLNINSKQESRHTKKLMEYKKAMDSLYELYSPNFLSDNDPKINIEDLSDDDFKDSYEDNDTEEYKKPEPPEHIKLTVSILKRSLHFLPNKNCQRKLLALDILTDGIPIISKWEDELLPIVHLTWSPLVDRFKDYNDPLIINRSFELLTVLALTSKNFIKSRTSKDVFPEICTNLRKLAEQSFLKDRGSAYRYTQSYKLQINILKNLAELITDLEMNINEVTVAMEASLPYLSNKQPIPLQEYAVRFYKTLALYDFDSVWLFLINIYGSPKQRKEQTCLKDNDKNVETLLKIMNRAKW